MSRKFGLLATAGMAAYLIFVPGVQADRGGTLPAITGDQPLVALVAAGRMKDLYLVDVYATGAADLRSYQVSVAASGGRRGSLELAGAVINKNRDDYVFGDAQVVTAESRVTGLLAAVAFDGGMEVADWAYLGTFLFRPSKDAAGEFQVSIKTTGSASILADSDNEPMEFVSAAAAKVQISTRPDVRVSSKLGSE